MNLSTLLHDCGLPALSLPDDVIHQITADSRQVGPGCVFVALKGTRQDGARFIPDAIASGACLIVQDLADNATRDHSLSTVEMHGRSVPVLHLSEPARFLARAAACLAGPQPDHIVAITGTNGKSSTADFLRQLWQLQGKKAASLGTLGLITDIDLPPLPPLTTPDPVSLATTLTSLKTHGIEHVALEASSHGLEQHRLDGVALTASGFTNLTRDHLDYHHTMDAYRTAKLRLFDTLLPIGHVMAINTDIDAETLHRLRTLATRKRFILREVGRTGSTLRLLSCTPRASGQEIHLALNGTELPAMTLPLPGRFQVDNALLAAALCWKDDADAPAVLALLPKLHGVSGRCECVAELPEGASVYVDYAHTPDALEHILQSLRPHTQGRLSVVFGAGGNRDAGKRPLMGQSAARYADHVIITDDNPRHEDPATIRSAILAGIEKLPAPYHATVETVGDRRRAIESAIARLGPGDVLLIAGKGHEKGQIIGDEIHPFDDRVIAKECAARREAKREGVTTS